ncbi:MAG: ATP-binding protein, partial [Bradymonadaceae bacterium]
ATMNLVPGGGTLGDELREDMGLTEIISDVLTLPEPPRQHRSPQPTPIHRVRLMPQTWRRKEAPRRTMEMVGVGIELFGLRQVPFVDRVEERDAIWNALWGVHQARKPRGILLTGLGGTGKTRLAEWITERAHEVGAASILTAHHSPISGPADGVGRMIANYLRCVGQSREHILTRVRALIGEDGPLDADDLHACMALTELIAPAADPHYDESSARVRFNNPKERHLVFQRFLARLATRRPILLLFDDIQWGNESLEYIQSLFEPLVSEKLPVLVLMTLGQEALAARPLAKRQVTAIWNERNVDTITVEPLKPDDHRQLIEHLLGLEADLVDKVVQRTAGNPLFAVQLIGDWIERGMLGLGRDGFYLKPGEEAWLPDDIHHVIRDRIAQLVKQDLDGPAQSALIALELAAALGHDVERREWEYACRLNGIPVPLLVLDAMVTSRLAQVNRQGWAFTQGVFRESLERLAIEAGRWPEHHRICAEMLIQLYSAHHPGIGQRIAHHFIEAGAWNEALEPLLLAARQNWVRCDFEPARALYNLYEDALEKLNLPPVDKRRIHGWTERASMLMRQNEIEEALALLDTAEAPARTQRWRLELGQILITRAKLFMQRGQISEGIILAQEAMAIFDEVEDPLGQIRSTYCLADLYYWGGNLTQALKYYIRALEGFIKLDEPYEAATVKMSLGALYTKLDRAEEGIASLEEAIEVFETVGDSNALANCLNSLGELNRFAGRLAQAEVYYQKALTTLERIGINDDTIVCFNLGLTLLAQEKYADADVIFKDVLRSLLASTRKGYIGLAHVGNLPGSAVNRDWKRWDHHLSEARRHLMESGMVDTDGARIAELAGKIAIEAGEDERGQLALALARKQFETLSGS